MATHKAITKNVNDVQSAYAVWQKLIDTQMVQNETRLDQAFNALSKRRNY